MSDLTTFVTESPAQSTSPGAGTNETIVFPPVQWSYAFLGIIPMWTTLANGVVVAAFATDKTLRCNLSNVIIASLSVADLLLAILVVPLAVYLKVNQRWGLGYELQLAWFCVDVFLSASSIMNLCVISVYRYLAIAYPFRIRYAMTWRHVVSLLATAWGIGFLVSMAMLAETLILGPSGGGVVQREDMHPQLVTPHPHVIKEQLVWHNYSDENLATPTPTPESSAKYMQGATPFLIYGSILTFYLPFAIMTFTGIRSIQLLNRQSLLSSHLHGGPPAPAKHNTSRLSQDSTTSSQKIQMYQKKRGSNHHENDNSKPKGTGSIDGSSKSKINSQNRRKSSPDFPQPTPECDSNNRRDSTLQPGCESNSRRGSTADKSRSHSLSVHGSVDENGNTHNQSSPGSRRQSPAAAAAGAGGRRFTGVFLGHRSSIFAVSSREQRAIRTLLIVFICFVICWFPFFTIQMVMVFYPKEFLSEDVLFDLAWPGYLSSGLNPIIYTLFNPEFNVSVKRLLRSVASSLRTNFSACSTDAKLRNGRRIPSEVNGNREMLLLKGSINNSKDMESLDKKK